MPESGETTLEIYCDALEEWRWRLVAANREIIAVSEGYTRAADARRAAERLREQVVSAKILELPR